MFSGNYHALVVHFPIVLLLFYPVLILASIFLKKQRESLFAAGCIALLLGTLGSVLASSTGEALEGWVQDIAPQIYAVFERHESYAEMTTSLGWILLTLHVVVYIANRYKNISFSWMPYIFVAGGVAIAALVSFTASEGGKLTHHYHVGAIHCQETAHPLGIISAKILGGQTSPEALQGIYTIDMDATSRQLFETICGGKLQQFQ